MSVTIVVTVGISIINNDRPRYNTFADRVKSRWTQSAWPSERLHIAGEYIANKDFIGTESAELQTLIAMIAQDYSDDTEKLNLRLIASDSAESEFCAEVVGKVLKEKFTGRVDYRVISVLGLNVDNYEEFRHRGINNLVRILIGINIERDSKQTVYCISGGFKGVVPVMTILAQLLDVKCFYNYERTSALIEIPVFPFDFDWKEWDEKHHKLMEPEKLSEDERRGLIEAGLMDRAGAITVFGSVMKAAALEKASMQAKT
jgi:putative CRISPR-associated protein (TIGR02619 family)